MKLSEMSLTDLKIYISYCDEQIDPFYVHAIPDVSYETIHELESKRDKALEIFHEKLASVICE